MDFFELKMKIFFSNKGLCSLTKEGISKKPYLVNAQRTREWGGEMNMAYRFLFECRDTLL